MQIIKSILLFAVMLTSFAACDNNEITEVVATENIFALPIRKVKDGQSIEDFKAKRDAYVATLEAQDGLLADREIQPFFEFTGSGLALDSVFVGFTVYQNQDVFDSIGEATNTTEEADAYFSTFDLISFQLLQPLDPEETVDLSDFANLGSGQVWEMAVRDLSQYDNFDQADYESKRDAYLAVLAAQDNFVKEVQWKSISDPNVVVGMTVYKDAASYQSVNQDQAFIDAYLATGFLQNYPINVYGAIHNVLK